MIISTDFAEVPLFFEEAQVLDVSTAIFPQRNILEVERNLKAETAIVLGAHDTTDFADPQNHYRQIDTLAFNTLYCGAYFRYIPLFGGKNRLLQPIEVTPVLKTAQIQEIRVDVLKALKVV